MGQTWKGNQIEVIGGTRIDKTDSNQFNIYLKTNFCNIGSKIHIY